MRISYTGRNLEVTPALKTVTAEKMQRLERRFNGLGDIHVTFHVEHLSQIAEANIHVNGLDLHAKATAQDMYAAIDELVDKLLGQITKHKEKHAGHGHRE